MKSSQQEFNKLVLSNQAPDSLDIQYHRIVHEILEMGVHAGNRTAVDTYSDFSRYMRISLAGGSVAAIQTRQFPKLTLLKELLWFISGSTDIGKLIEQNVHLWDSWVRPDSAVYSDDGKLIGGDIGQGAYGAQWRAWQDAKIINAEQLQVYKDRGYDFVAHLPGENKALVYRKIDQLMNAQHLLKTDPTNRRILVSAWNAGALEDMQLPPCHTVFFFKAVPLINDYHQNPTVYIRQLASWLTYAIYNQEDERVRSVYVDLLGLPLSPLKSGEGLARVYNTLHSALSSFVSAQRHGELKAFDELKPKYILNLHLTCRSQDLLVGTVANIFQYSLLCQMMAKVTGMVPGSLSWTGVDVHIYENQLEECKQQMQIFEQGEYPASMPWIKITGNQTSIDDFAIEDFEFNGFNPDAKKITYKIAV